MRALEKRDWLKADGLSDRERALCTLAEKLSRTPAKVTDDDWAPLRRLGFDDRGCLEVAHVAGLFNYLTRLADGFGLVLEAGTERAAKTGVSLERSAPR